MIVENGNYLVFSIRLLNKYWCREAIDKVFGLHSSLQDSQLVRAEPVRKCVVVEETHVNYEKIKELL